MRKEAKKKARGIISIAIAAIFVLSILVTPLLAML